MAKTKFSLKITGLEISYEGEREDLPRFTSEIGGQLVGLATLPNSQAQNRGSHLPTQKRLFEPQGEAGDAEVIDVTPVKKSKKAKRTNAARNDSTPAAVPPNWRHSAEKWGNPRESWNPTKKSIWLLYVLMQEQVFKEMSASEISKFFNTHFRTFGQIVAANVSRDLRKAQKQTPPPIQSITALTPEKWFLTESGIQQAASLVTEARGG